MIKAAVLAALLGLAASLTSDARLGYVKTGEIVKDDNNYYNLKYTFNFDFGYDTHYAAIEPMSALSTILQGESYGSRVYAEARLLT